MRIIKEEYSIIKEGKNYKKRARCKKCGCVFTYTIGDDEGMAGGLICPCCHKTVMTKKGKRDTVWFLVSMILISFIFLWLCHIIWLNA